MLDGVEAGEADRPDGAGVGSAHPAAERHPTSLFETPLFELDRVVHPERGIVTGAAPTVETGRAINVRLRASVGPDQP